MNFSKGQKNYIIHALEHCEVLTGGRSSGKTLELIKQQEQEIERLNNIINELEKWLEEIKDRVIMYGIDDDTYKTTNLYRDIKLKIKELKGVDKE